MKLAVKVTSMLVLLTAACAAVAQAEQLGRLFFTPEDRALLDRQRQANRNAPIDDGSPITLNGRVFRSSGRNTAWVNGVPIDEADARTLSHIPLRPGQSLRNSGDREAADLLNGGTITVHRDAARR